MVSTKTVSQERVDTKRVSGRRELWFSSWDEVVADLDGLASARADGRLGTVGNWSAGQVFEHLAGFIEMTVEGFGDSVPPWWMRVVGRSMLRGWALSDRAMPAGIRLRGPLVSLEPAPDAGFDSSRASLLGWIGRVRDGGGAGGSAFISASPLLGPLTHEEWTKLHLKHCAHHLSFLTVG